MFRINSILFTILLLMSCATAEKDRATNGFDSACLIFQKAATMHLNPQELGDYIADELDKMEPQFASNDVKEVYHALFNVDPAMRYSLFKESAETALKRSWDCSAIRDLYN